MNSQTLRAEITKVESLLLEALSIERDLSSAQCPESRSVENLRSEYRFLASRLAVDYGLAINRYLKYLRGSHTGNSKIRTLASSALPGG